MSWLGSFGVLPSPNHVLAKLAIFRGAEHSPHSPRATDSAAVFYYYFKPFVALPAPLAADPFPHLSPSRSPVSSPSSPYHLRPVPVTIQPPSLATFPGRTANHPPPLPPAPITPSCLRAEMKISRLLAIETELLFHEVVDPPLSDAT